MAVPAMMTPLHLSSPPPLLLLHARRIVRIPNAASDGSSGEPSPATSTDDTTPSSAPSNDPKPVGIKNRLRATRNQNQARRVQLDAPPPEIVTPEEKKQNKKKVKAPAAARGETSQRSPKKWEEMSLAEKALELYVGEKGLLFWLNKFAYASIFIMVGAWVLFRFVGPSLGLYQLDAPPLPPTAVFGS